jgi:protein SCO1
MKTFFALWLCLLATASAAAPSAATLPPESVYHVEAALTDQAGRALQWRDGAGTPQLVSMFYTSCRYVCPLIVDSAKGVEHALGDAERARLRFLLVSMDPARDTPEALASVAARRKLDPARWRLVRPAAGDVRSLAAVLGIRYRALADGEFNHTSALVLLDAQGRVLARTERLGAVPDPEFLAAVRAALEGGAPAN